MSRPNGPVRHPGLAPQSETQPNSYAPATGESYADAYAHPPADNNQQVIAGQSGHTQSPPHSNQPPTYAQSGQPDAYAAHTEPGGHTYAPQQPPQTSWADMNQPVQSAAPQQPNYGYQHPYGHGHDPAPQDAGAQQPPQQATTASYDPAYSAAAPSAPQHPHPPQYSTPMPSTTPSAAPSGYDFASYDAPQPAPPLERAVQPGQDAGVNWGQSEFAAAAGAAPGSDFGLTTQTSGLDPHQQPVHVDDAYAGEDEEYEYEDEEEGGRGRGTLIAAALAGAIVIGGGMAYGYQSIFGGSASDKPPVVRGASTPAKVKPADPGGRKFAHTDSKIMGRLGASGKTNDPAGGARRVSTLRIGRDGSVMPPGNPTATGAGQRMVTGMTLGAAAPGQQAAAQPATATKAASKAAPIVVKPPATKAPAQIAKATTQAAPKPPAPAVTAPVKRAPVAKVPVKPAAKPAPTKKVAVAKPTAPAVTAPKPTGAGYVAVLASIPLSKTSRMDALKQFADLQQKYGTALQNKTPDVQRADLGEKGSYHRLVAGPPGSSQSARSVCSALKSAGYPSCWVLAY